MASHIDVDSLRQFDFRIAQTGEVQALLEHRTAIDKALNPVDKSARRNVSSVDGHDEFATHFLAKNESDQIVASCRIVLPEHRPFEIEEAIGLTATIDEMARPAEIGRLRVHQDFRTIDRSPPVALGFIVPILTFAQSINLSDIVAGTWPRLIPFYRALGFKRIAPEIDHPRWGAGSLVNIAVAQAYADLDDASTRLGRISMALGRSA